MKTNKFIAGSILAAVLATSVALADAPGVAAPAPNATVYVQTLPTPAALTKAAAVQNLTVAQISQTNDQITVVYKTATGQTNTVAYRPLSALADAPVTATAPATVVVPATPAPTTTVVYTRPAYTYTYDPYYYPGWGYPAWDWYPPVTIGLGFSWYHGWGGRHGGDWDDRGWHGGGWHGGWHH